MRVKTIVDEDFTNYKKPAMFIGTISCGGKCCIEAGIPLSVCQNDGWRASAPISIDDEQLCLRYLNNPLTESIVFGGLEPLEQFDELRSFLEVLRGQFQCKDDVVIYTGYYFEEVPEWIQQLATYGNVCEVRTILPNQSTYLMKCLASNSLLIINTQSGSTVRHIGEDINENQHQSRQRVR